MCNLTKILFLFCAFIYLINAATFTTAASTSIQGSNPTSHALSTDDDNAIVTVAAKKRCAICIDRMNSCHSKGKKSWDHCQDETCKSMGTKCNFCKGITCPASPMLARADISQSVANNDDDGGSEDTIANPPSPTAPGDNEDSSAICNRVCSIWLHDCAKMARDPIEQAACYGHVCKQKNCVKCFSCNHKANAKSFWGR